MTCDAQTDIVYNGYRILYKSDVFVVLDADRNVSLAFGYRRFIVGPFSVEMQHRHRKRFFPSMEIIEFRCGAGKKPACDRRIKNKSSFASRWNLICASMVLSHFVYALLFFNGNLLSMIREIKKNTT